MKKLEMEKAQGVALKALREYPRADAEIVESFMKSSKWSAGGKGDLYLFTLFDTSKAVEAGTAGTTQPAGWIKAPEPLLTIYVDRLSAKTFIHRHVKKYPWEKAA